MVHVFCTFTANLCAYRSNLLNLQFAVTRMDGSPYSSNYFRTISISTTHIGSSGTLSYETKQIIPDDSVVKYTVLPGDEDTKISVRVRWLFKMPLHYGLPTGNSPEGMLHFCQFISTRSNIIVSSQYFKEYKSWFHLIATNNHKHRWTRAWP